MAIQYTSNYQFNAPTDAAGVSVTPSGTTQADSAWVTVFTADADCVLTSVIVYQAGVASLFRVDVGVSIGGGGETVIASHGGWSAALPSSIGWGLLPFRIPIDAIPNGAVVKVRMAKNGTNTTAWFFALQYYKKPIVGNLLTTANPQLITNVLTLPTVAASTTPWANSSWGTVFTPGADSVISGWVQNVSGNGQDYIFEIGQSSSPIYTIKDRTGNADYTLFRPIKHPLTVASGSAVQQRVRKSAASPTTCGTAFTYYELPL